ncbi:MAG: GIY-YIG nuclease family protein [Candidatus Shapirobacteria bacterium]|nr:GIY-YIG nuclease family protein [Candidatus Shapirobacteria bacterium]
MIDLKTLPGTPGVYIYRNFAGEIIYVGKAINLKKRVTQYFQRDDALGSKTTTLVSQIASIETKTVDSEIQALILEASLIKKYKPKYNSLLKDDRSYIYICITKEPIPRVFTARFSQLTKNDHIYGPFPNGSAVNSLLKTLRRIFPYRSRLTHPQAKCLYCHLGLCPGSHPEPKLYRQNIGKLKKVLSGKITSLQRQLTKEMKFASKSENYESALELRRQLESINYVVSGWSALHNFYEKVDLPEDVQSSAIQELMTTLNPYFHPPRRIDRIECFDISQMGLKHFVGSMTVYLNGHIDKSQYRKFKINTKVTPDDQYMIKEVVFRRLQHPEWGTPDLIMVDGGKPQVTSATSLTDIPIIGLAKRLETIVIKLDDDWVEINLPLRSNALRLLQSLRDEAHRFANRYRRTLMKKSINDS